MKRLVITSLLLVALLLAVQVAAAQGQDCPWGYPAYDSATRAFVSQCSAKAETAPAKPVGLAQPAPAAAQSEQVAPGCPLGYAYNPISHDVVWMCLDGQNAAAKPAGLAQPAPVPAVNCASYAGPGYSICVIASPK